METKEFGESMDLLERKVKQDIEIEKLKEKNKNKNNNVKVNCQCYYCGYENDGVCGLDEIVMNAGGICQNCVMVNLPSEDVKKAKEEFLGRKEKRPEFLKGFLSLIKYLKEEENKVES